MESPLLSFIKDKSDHDAVKVLFANARGSDGATGWRLSDVGLQLMKTCFKCYDVTLRFSRKHPHPHHLIYLDRVSNFPYWLSPTHLSTFDGDLAMMLKLADSDLGNLIATRFRLTLDDDFMVLDK